MSSLHETVLYCDKLVMTPNKHENYEILNLIGYGLAKFNEQFVQSLGFSTKQAFYEAVVESGIAQTVGTVKNRQDLFDPFFDNDRKGWWQKGDAYLHRKRFIDALFGDYDAKAFSSVVKLSIESKVDSVLLGRSEAAPIIKSKFKQLQTTGLEAELYFLDNFGEVGLFKNGLLEDARLFGDGYDFQIQIGSEFFLAEIKGLRSSYGSIRLTEKEYSCAVENKENYSLVVVSGLENVPKMTPIVNPVENLALEENSRVSKQISYHSKSMSW